MKSDFANNKKIIIKNIHTRRLFIKRIIGAGIIINLPLLKSCDFSGNADLLTSLQKEITEFVFDFLWPDDNFGPGARDIKVYGYLLWMLNDKNLDPEENQYVLNGMNWVDETSVEVYNKHFDKLTKKEKHSMLNKISNLEWGENWLSKMLSILIEAMFADPIYGSNPGGIVWKWFEHDPGRPRPDDNNKYPVILRRKDENEVISNINQL